jgi:hypothetical protein
MTSARRRGPGRWVFMTVFLSGFFDTICGWKIGFPCE